MSSALEPDFLPRLRGIDWTDARTMSATAPALLADLAARPDVLGRLYADFEQDPALRDMSERLAELDKVVLLNDRASGARIRLHVFRQGYFDRPHNHRFNFATQLLQGGYVHTTYGQCNDDDESYRAFFPTPRMVRTEGAGDGYVIEHSLVHSVAATAHTVTLTLRGPAVKDRMFILGADGPMTAWGVEEEDPATVAARRLSDATVAEIGESLVGASLVALPVGSAH